MDAVRGYFAHFAEGDFDAVKAQFAPDAVVSVPGGGKLAGSYVGAAGFDEFLGILGSHVDAESSGFGVVDLCVGETYAIAREVATLVRQDEPGRTWELPLLLRFTTAGGVITDLTIVPEDLVHYDEFWAAR